MIRLRDDSFTRKPVGARLRRSSGVAIFSLLLLSLALLVLSRIDNPLLRQARQLVIERATPVLAWMSSSIGPIRQLGEKLQAMKATAAEIETLKAENQRLAGWEARAVELERRLADLDSLARVVHDPALEFLTGRVITNVGGPFARSALLNIGRAHGIRNGYPVISADGTVGRIIEIAEQSSRILLLTDLNSRIPVLIGANSAKAILMGDNTDEPRLAHLSPGDPVAAGDRVVTSGVGGLFPRGLRIGTVVETASGLKVSIHARLDRLDHVSVLFYNSPALDLIVDEPQGKPPMNPVRTPAAALTPPVVSQNR